MLSPIHITFGPHVTGTYLLQSIAKLLQPWRWLKGPDRAHLKKTLERWFEMRAFLFFSGREALVALLRSLPEKQGNIIIQGYTCVAVPNAIHAAGYTPVYADIDPETLNLDPADVERKITVHTRAIMCQHTFGIVADTEALREIADRHRILLIEDCAHVLPDVTGPKVIGKFADALILSFGRDKAVSGIGGGGVLVRSDALAARLRNEEERAAEASLPVVFRLLCYPLLYSFIKPLYGIIVGKGIAWVCRRLRLLPPVLTAAERQGYQTPVLRKMPNACAALAVWEFRRFHTINNHRRMMASFYLREASTRQWKFPNTISEHFPLQKFPIFVGDPDAIRRILKRKNIHLNNGWIGAVVCPRSVDQETAGYAASSCPNAERVAKEVLHLPTHPTMTERQAEFLVKELKELRIKN